MRQPSGHRETLLPLVDVGSKKFEELCREILTQRFPHVMSTSLKRESGQRQYGVDVEGFDVGREPNVVISCKCYRDIKAWHFKVWIDDFLKHLDGHWKGKKVEHFVLAVSHECNDDDMNDAARNLVKELKERGIQFHLWNAFDITDLLRKKGLVDLFFGSHWVQAVSATASTTLPSFAASAPQTAGPQFHDLGHWAQQLADVARRINGAFATRLDGALQGLRAGRTGALEACLAEALADPTTWSSLEPQMRAKALRAKAMLHLQRNEAAQARMLLDQADTIAPASDMVARVFLARTEGAREHALAILASPSSVRERELKATLLLEMGRLEDAATILNGITGTEVSAEVLRLRAITEFLQGKRDRALRTAVSAHQRAPDDTLPLMTLGVIRLMSALVEGVEPQFGSMPNPINPSLVKEGHAACDAITTAISDFERLLLTVEQPLRSEVEIWKLAALLLHPERRREARTFARILLRRDEVEPLAVAWAKQFGLGMRAGKVRKSLLDAINRGRGSASHVVMLALMVAEQKGPAAGLAVINRSAGLFPDDAGFFTTWRAQFGDLSGVDKESYAAVMHSAIHGKNHAPLVSFLMSAAASLDNIISGAEYFASREAWSDLDQVRPQLLRIRTSRALDLAASAALRSGKPKDCLAILEAAAEAFDEGKLPPRLIFLRIEAHEHLGLHQPVIKDLQALLTDRNDPRLQHRLMGAYLRVGALREFQVEAERVLGRGGVDARNAVAIADVLRTYAPDTARKALTHAVSTGVVGAEIAGAMLFLASSLGLAEIEREMMPLAIQNADDGTSGIRFETTEDLLAFFDNRAREHRDAFSEWLHGRSPAAVAMRSDPKAYGRLFLAEPAERRNMLGDSFPMLLFTGAHLPGRSAVPSGRPILRIDLSALLLAARLDLVGALQGAFSLQIPPSLPDALISLEREFHAPDPTVVAAVQKVFIPGASAVEIVGSIPAGAAGIENPEDPTEIRTDVVQALIAQAFRDGQLTQSQAERALTALDAPTDLDGSNERYSDGIVLTPSSLCWLARVEVLEPIAQTVPTYMLSADAERLRANMRSAEDEGRIRSLIAQLRELVAGRLLEGAWTTVPLPSGEGKDPENFPPAFRCLYEIISAQESRPELFWIEDRVVSRHPSEQSLDMLGILDHLSQRHLLPEARRSEILRELRQAGYGFLGPDQDEILRAIRQTRLQAGELVETQDLIDIRTWFAAEVARLRYADTTPIMAPDGKVAGEMRHILKMGSLARELLNRIWSDRETTSEQREAWSAWVWTCLRFEQVDFVPAGAAPETRRQYVAVAMAHVIDLPLLADLDPEGMPREAQQEFVTWLLQEAVHTKVEADPALGDEIVEILAFTLGKFLDRHDDTGDKKLDAALERTVKVKAQRFLDLLPDSWSERIAARHGVGEKLQHRSTVVLTLADDVIVPAVAFAEAYSRGMEGAKAGEPARVEVAVVHPDQAEILVEATDGILPSAILIVEGRRLRIDEVTRALAHPDGDVRRVGLSQVADLVDVRGAIRSGSLDRIAALDSVEERFSAIADLLHGDFHRHLARLGARLSARTSFGPGDLRLPSPASLATYLRIEDLQDVPVEELPSRALGGLLGDLGVLATAERLAGLPVSLPADLLEQIGGALRAPDAPVPGQRADTPLLALLRLRALASAGGADGDALVAGTRAFLDAFATKGQLFVAFLRLGGRQALKDEQWAALPDPLRVALLWSFADLLTRTFAVPGMDTRHFAKYVTGLGPLKLTELQRANGMAAWVRHMTFDFTLEDLAAATAAELVRMGVVAHLPEDVVPGIKALVGTQGNTVWIPNLDIIFPPPPAPAPFWTAQDPVPPLMAAGWIAEADPFATRAPSAMVERLVAEEIDQAHPHILPSMLAVIDVERVDAELVPRIRDVLQAAQGEAALEPDQGGLQRILLLWARVLARQGDTNGFLEVLRRHARRCAHKWPRQRLGFSLGGEGAALGFMFIADAVFAHAFAMETALAERMAVFTQGMRAVAEEWPNAIRSVIGILDSFVEQLDVESAGVVWPTLLELRAKP